MNYNKKRHIELLKKELKSMLSKEDYSELSEYSRMLSNHLEWEARDHSLELLEDFRKGKIEYFEFCSAFKKRSLLMDNVANILQSNLILLSPDEKSFGFSDLIREICDYCDMYRFEIIEIYFDIEKPEEFDDKNPEIELKNFFKNSIEKIYFQVQKYLDE